METFKIENLSFTYPNQETPAISDINLSVSKGDFLVICGHSGCGKSTLLRQLKPLIAPHGTLSGNISFCGTPVKNINEKTIAAKIGFVLQNPESQIVTDKVWHELAFGLESIGESSDTIRRRCAEMAAFFGIEDWYRKNVSKLSGGQKQLLSLASVMTMQPEVLILDEPTAQLDPIAASEFLATLSKINREIGTTVIISEHRLEESIPPANKIAVMKNGKIICCDTAENVGAYLKSTNSEMFSAMPAAMRVWESVNSDYVCPVTVNDGRKFILKYLENHKRHPVIFRDKAEEQREKCIDISEVYFRYEREQPDVIKNLNFSAFSGELLCILGGNGSGKTTTLKLITGIKRPYRGEVNCKGKIGFLPQDPKTLFSKKTVYDNLYEVLNMRGIKKGEADNNIAKVAELCQIENILQKHPYDISGGEQQRAALAKVLLFSPDILLLDEPTKGLDVPFKNTLAAILQQLKNSGVCIVMVSHDTEFCAKYSDRCGLFFDGCLVNVSKPVSFFSGNSFYTTAANRMVREIEPNAITVEDVISLLGGKTEEVQLPANKAPKFETPNVLKSSDNKLPLWRKAGALISTLLALSVLIYAVKNENLSQMITENGITQLGKSQLLLYAAFIVFVIFIAVFLGKKSKPDITLQAQTPKEKRKLTKRTVVASAIILLCIPVTLFAGIVYFDSKQYYLTALAVLTECIIPFFLIFEDRKPKARELVVIATLCALTIAGRAAFFMLPQFKPVMALTIIAGVALGGETGFFVGAVSMLVSNMLFSQGPWTPWQMFAMGLIGFLAGVLFKKGVLLRTRSSLCAFGAICTFVIYGGIMNPISALIWGNESINLKIIISYYVSGFPMDVVHAAATVIFLWFGAEPMLEKLDRIKTKYGLIEP